MGLPNGTLGFAQEPGLCPGPRSLSVWPAGRLSRLERLVGSRVIRCKVIVSAVANASTGTTGGHAHAWARHAFGAVEPAMIADASSKASASTLVQSASIL